MMLCRRAGAEDSQLWADAQRATTAARIGDLYHAAGTQTPAHSGYCERDDVVLKAAILAQGAPRLAQSRGGAEVIVEEQDGAGGSWAGQRHFALHVVAPLIVVEELSLPLLRFLAPDEKIGVQRRPQVAGDRLGDFMALSPTLAGQRDDGEMTLSGPALSGFRPSNILLRPLVVADEPVFPVLTVGPLVVADEPALPL